MQTTFSLSAELRTGLLLCGVLSGLLTAGTDLVAGLLKPGYRFDAMSASVLTAPGTSTRPYVLSLNLLSGLLLIAFSAGVWDISGQNWAFKAIALALAGSALFSMIATAFFPMHMEEPMNSPANRINVILMFMGVFLYFLAIIFGIFANHNWFRFVSLGMVLFFATLVVFGIAISNNQPEIFGQHGPLVGVQERTMIYTWQIWLIIQALVLI